MAWIESHQELRDHPKVRRFARRLGISIPAAIGHLHLLWWWALDYAMDGDLSKYDAADIADAAQWDGDPDEFLAALMECGVGGGAGFVERTDDGELLLHDWWDYAGKLIQQRTAYSEAGLRGNHERWHVRRGIQDPNCPLCQQGSPSQSPPESGGESRGDRDQNRGEIANHRTKPQPQPNRTVPNLTVPRDKVDANASTPDGQDDAPTAKGQIAELVATYREACNATPLQRDYAFMGRLYNSYPIDQIYAAIDQAALQIAAGQQLEDPLRYIAGVLRNTNSPARASPGGRQTRETPIDRKLRQLGVI